MHQQIMNRLREPAPTHLGVMPGTLPVISFGDFLSPEVRVATIALNPSSREFWASKGKWLSPAKTRLASRHSLGLTAADALTDDHLAAVVAASNVYFQGNPLKDWFTPLNDVLKESFGVDYWDGTACHLDLVQWATSPVQGELGEKWSQLVEADRDFLRWQIDATPASVLVLNSASVVRELVRTGVVSEPVVSEFGFTAGNGHAWRLRFFRAEAQGKMVVGWNHVIARHRSWPAGARDRLIEELRSCLTESGGQGAVATSGAATKPHPAGWQVTATDYRGEIFFSGIVPWEDRRFIKILAEEHCTISTVPLDVLPDPESTAS